MATLLTLLLACTLCRGITASFEQPDIEEQSTDSQTGRLDPLLSPQEHSSDESDTEKEKRKLRSVLQSIDNDGDGRITVQELAALTDRSMKAFYKQEADRNIQRLDTNKDGKVTWDEYVKTAGNRGAELTPEQAKRDRRRFNHADSNNDGCLSHDELVSIYHPEESPHMFTVILEEFLEFVDSDKNGFISFNEYKEKAIGPHNTNLEAAKESFRRLDKNQDRKLDKEEMKIWLAALDTASQAKNQAERLVDMSDDDRDGVLTEEEIVNHMELFTAGSKGYQSEQNVKDEL